MKEITEIERHKYIVIKNSDLKYLEDMDKLSLIGIISSIEKGRRFDGKNEENKYLVLNLDDEIAELYLEDAIDKIHRKAYEVSRDTHTPFKKVKVSDIAVAIVNAILKAKEKPFNHIYGCKG